MNSELPSVASLLAISDLHVAYPENRQAIERMRPNHPGDWLIVAGDVGEVFEEIEWALGVLADRYAQVIWVPGNHELWTHPKDGLQLRGEARYRHLVETCRRLGVLTPEDPYPVWCGPGGPVVIAPLFTLYDYSFHPPGTSTKEAGLAAAYEVGVVCTDEMMLFPDPYPSREAWCAARLAYSRQRLEVIDTDLPTVLVNHWPLVRDPTRVLRYPEFAQWCGTVETAGWHLDFRAAVMVYGHLHIPRTTWYGGVRFEEVSVGYPREWKPRGGPSPARTILPASGNRS